MVRNMSTFGKQKFKINYCCSGGDTNTMQRNAAVLTVACIMMCLTFNSTFPLQRNNLAAVNYPNQTLTFDIPVHRNTIVDRSKNMASNLGSALKRFKDSTQDLGKNIYEHVSSGLKEHINIISEEDLRQYEQMVIMKKYPYLDLKELEQKFSAPKNTRQSQNVEHHNSNIDNEPGIHESLEDGLNVEITNRGLSGFAIPPELTTKQVSNIMECKTKLDFVNDNNRANDGVAKIIKKSSINDMLGSLKNDIKEYVERKAIN